MTSVETRTTDLTTLAAEINAEHRACEQAAVSAVQHALNAGELLSTAKASLPHGVFGPWLKENFAGSERMAQRYMHLYRRRDELNPTRVSDLSIRGALAELSASVDKEGCGQDDRTEEGKIPKMPRAYYVTCEEIERLEARIKSLDLFEYDQSGLPVVKDGVDVHELELMWKLLEAQDGLTQTKKSILAKSVGLTNEQMEERVRNRRARTKGA